MEKSRIESRVADRAARRAQAPQCQLECRRKADLLLHLTCECVVAACWRCRNYHYKWLRRWWNRLNPIDCYRCGYQFREGSRWHDIVIQETPI